MAEFEKVLIQSGSVLYTTANGFLEELIETEPTAALFQTYGADVLPEWEIIKRLINPQVLLWNSSTETIPTATAKMTALPPSQIITSESATITGTTAVSVESVLIEYEGNPLFSCSFDGGNTWEIFDGSAWVIISNETTGMTANEFMAITTQQWASSLFAFDSIAVRFLLSNAEDKVYEILIKYTQKEEE